MAEQRVVRLGLWIWGDFYETDDPKNGHIEIAYQIINKKGWQGQFEASKFEDPVDFLIFEKEGVKIGNRYGKNVITLCDKTKGREVDNVLLIYEMEGWFIDYIHNPYLK